MFCVGWYDLRGKSGETYSPLIAGAILRSAQSAVGWAGPLATAEVSFVFSSVFPFSFSYFLGSAAYSTPVPGLFKRFFFYFFSSLNFFRFDLTIFNFEHFSFSTILNPNIF
jgi:hypothetical protein